MRTVVLACAAIALVRSNGVYEINARNGNRKVYWNVPTFQCDPHGLNFTTLAKKYGITQNRGDRFRGEHFAILYDPGDFPALLEKHGELVRRNGGIPQLGNLTLHLQLFGKIVEKLIPEETFSGLGVIDFESWRPIFRQNFGALKPYKDLSIKHVKQMHPFWPEQWVEKEARQQFEDKAKLFMRDTLILAKSLRPKATWGYYAYPYCFNMNPNTQNANCPKEVEPENNQLKWFFELEDAFYPSVYLSSKLTAGNKVQLIEGRIKEANRVKKFIRKDKKIYLYYWYKYHDTKEFLTKEDVFNTITALGASNINGLILWGSSGDVNSKQACLNLYKYVDKILGPILVNFM